MRTMLIARHGRRDKRVGSPRHREAKCGNSVRGWSGLSSFGLSIWLALSIVFRLGTTVQRAAAQSTTADILGTAIDSTGAILPGAKAIVTALATSEKRETTANAAGEFVFNNLNPGHYRVEVAASGFKTFVVPDLLAAAGDRARQR
jgi:hypothetical protein